MIRLSGRRPNRVLAMLCAIGVVTPMLVCAQESSNKSIHQLTEEIQKLEGVASDTSATAEVNELNQKFLSERRESLRKLLRLRIDALQKYHVAVKDTLNQSEKDVLVASIRDLENLLNMLEADTPRASSFLTETYHSPEDHVRLEGIPVSYKDASRITPEQRSYAMTEAARAVPSASPGIGFPVASSRAEPEPPVPVQTPTPRPDMSVDVATEQLSGDKIRGPATIQLKNLNILRYNITVGKTVNFTPGPDLKLPFIPPIPDAAAKNNQGSNGAAVGAVGPLAGTACNTIPVCFNEAVSTLNGIEGEKARDVNGEIVRVSGIINRVKSDLDALISASDSILTTAGPQAVINNVSSFVGTAPGGSGTLNNALNAEWPDNKIENLLGRLDVLKNTLIALPTLPPNGGPDFSTWLSQDPANKTAYEGAIARITELQTQLGGLRSANSSNAAGVAFRDAKNKLSLWGPIFVGVRDGGVASFTRTVRVGCGFAFDSNKETKVTAVKQDRLAEPTSSPLTQDIVTVVCSSPLTVSAGFGFSNINEREFVFVPSTKTVTDSNGQTSQVVINRFGFKNNSSFRTLPVLLLNTRVWEPTDWFALHVSTGAAVDIKTGDGGTDLEYIVGPSFSFWRSIFITPGLHIGRVPKLAGGFTLDQEVPAGVSEPPLEKAWKRGFVTTFTYKIR